jgi:hypothetical protein
VSCWVTGICALPTDAKRIMKQLFESELTGALIYVKLWQVSDVL